MSDSKGRRGGREGCGERQKGLRWRKAACGGERARRGGVEKKGGGGGAGESFVFSPSALLYDTRKSDSYHNGRMNHSHN